MGGLLHVGIKDCDLPAGAPSPRDQKVLGEPIRTLWTRSLRVDPATTDEAIFRPKKINVLVGTSPAAGLAVTVPAPNTISITYIDGVTTTAQVAAAVALVVAANDLLEMLGDPGGVWNAPSATTTLFLWTDLIAVPGAGFKLDSEGRWVPWDGSITGGAGMLAALTAIQANTAPDNRLGSVTHSLAAALTDHSLGISGRTLAVLNLTGTASVRLVNAGGTWPTAPAPAMDIFPLDRWNFDFTDVLLTCAAQALKSITLYAGWRV